MSHFKALVFFKPKRVAISGGYFGCHATIEVYSKSRDTNLEMIDLDDEFQPGDLCWLETPLNPTGESRSLALSCPDLALTVNLSPGISVIMLTKYRGSLCPRLPPLPNDIIGSQSRGEAISGLHFCAASSTVSIQMGCRLVCVMMFQQHVMLFIISISILHSGILI